MKRDVQFVRALDAPYREVRDRLRDDPRSLFGTVTSDGIVAPLSARLGRARLHRDLVIDIAGFDEPAGAKGGAHVMIRADAARHPRVFPHLEARLDAVPITGTRTALFFVATYKAPFGLAGGAADALILHRLAEEALSGWFDQISDRLIDP